MSTYPNLENEDQTSNSVIYMYITYTYIHINSVHQI